MATSQPSQPSRHKLNFSLDSRLVIAVLLAVIAIMLLLWKPWDPTAGANARTVQVTGETTLTSEPDEFAFYPTYSFTDSDEEAALAAMDKKSDEVIAGLKKLGVPDSKIKTNSDNYDHGGFSYPKPDTSGNTYTLRLTVTIEGRELAQKVQDYLIDTKPGGTISPIPTFSDKKRKELENKARDEATRDARKKAEQSANNLGFRLGKVKAVADGSGFGDIIALDSRGSAEPDKPISSGQLSVQPGENELHYSVTVTYFIR